MLAFESYPLTTMCMHCLLRCYSKAANKNIRHLQALPALQSLFPCYILYMFVKVKLCHSSPLIQSTECKASIIPSSKEAALDALMFLKCNVNYIVSIRHPVSVHHRSELTFSFIACNTLQVRFKMCEDFQLLTTMSRERCKKLFPSTCFFIIVGFIFL